MARVSGEGRPGAKPRKAMSCNDAHGSARDKARKRPSQSQQRVKITSPSSWSCGLGGEGYGVGGWGWVEMEAADDLPLYHFIGIY